MTEWPEPDRASSVARRLGQRTIWLAAIGCTAACTAVLEPETSPPEAGRRVAAPETGDVEAGGRAGDANGANGPNGANGANGANGGSEIDPCADAQLGLGEAPIRRLSVDEYWNTVDTLFPSLDVPREVEIVPDEVVDGFDNSAIGQAISSLNVEQYAEAAASIGRFAGERWSEWASCDPVEGEACIRTLVDEFGRNAYRRPITDDERSAMSNLLREGLETGGTVEGVAMLIEGVLQSPHFLYRPELGRTDDRRLLTAHELASRLSYFLWQSPPDDELYARAADESLLDSDVYDRQIRRMLADPRARATVSRFFAQWLGVDEISELALDRAAYPQLDDSLRADLAASVSRYVEKAFWEDDSITALFAGTFGYVNDRLAPIFDVPPPGTDDLVLVELSPSRRKGVLTQPGLLASTSHGLAHSPIFRGVTMLERVLCAPAPSPPDGILENFDPPDGTTDADICTTRDYITLTHTTDPSCQACHASIDGAGYAFEHYDALGRFRTTENGCPIDASGELTAHDLGGPFSNATELADRLAQSTDVAECVAKHWFRFAFGRTESRDDICQIRALVSEMRENDGSLQSLVVALLESPSFRTRSLESQP